MHKWREKGKCKQTKAQLHEHELRISSHVEGQQMRIQRIFLPHGDNDGSNLSYFTATKLTFLPRVVVFLLVY